MITLPFALSVRLERLPEGTPGAEAAEAETQAAGTWTVETQATGTETAETEAAGTEAAETRTTDSDATGSTGSTDFPAVIRGEIRLPEGGSDSAVVLIHGFKGFRRWGFFPHLADRLVEDGHAVVSFDFSLNGVGEGGLDFDELEAFARNTFTRELAELAQVVEALRGGSLPGPVPTRIGLLGHSRGGGIGILGARELGVDALVTWASVATFRRWDDATCQRWKEAGRIHVANARTNQEMPLDVTLLEDVERNAERLDIEAAAGALDIPWLIVHGDDDQAVPVAEAERLSHAAPDARLQVIAGAGHTFGAAHPFVGEGEDLSRALSLTRAHLKEALGRP